MVHVTPEVPSQACGQSSGRSSSNAPAPAKADGGEGPCFFMFKQTIILHPHPLLNLIDALEGWNHVRGTLCGQPNVLYPTYNREVGEEGPLMFLISALLLFLSFSSHQTPCEP